MKHKVEIESRITECGDGCCTEYWDTLIIDGVEVARTQHMEMQHLVVAALNYFGIEAE